LIRSFRLTFTAGAVGERVITIRDTTDAADRPGNISQPLSFTIFVVPALDTTTSLTLAGAGANGYTIGNDLADQPVNTLFTGGTNAPIVYTVEGSGRLYIRETYTGGAPRSTSRAAQTLSTSSDANVYLDMNGSSNKVTAYVRDRNAAETGRTVAFIFNYASIEIISGDNQTGVPNARLLNALGVRVEDSRGRPVPGLPVLFTPASGATLKPVIGTDVYLTNPPTTNTWATAFAATVQIRQATATVPEAIAADTAALVPTDRSGEAQVYLEVGAAGTKTVLVSAGGAMKTFFATSAETTDIPTLEVLSGDNQRSESNGKVTDPLIVRVLTSANQPFPAQLVTFTTTKGYLTTLAAYQDSTSTPATVNGPATQVTARTDLRGRAAVSYDLVNHEGAADVIAEISSSTVPVYQRRVTFNINGTGSTTTNQQQQQQQQQQQEFDAPPDDLIIDDGNNQSGEPGATLSQPFVVQLLDTEGDPLDDIEVTFTVLSGGGSLSDSTDTTDSSGRAETRLTLGSSGTHTVRASVDFAGVSSVTFTATASAPAPVANRLEIEEGDNQSGELNRLLPSPLIVQLLDQDGDPIQGLTIAFEVTEGRGRLSPRTARTDNQGFAEVNFTPSSIGNIEVEASVRGIDTISPVTFTISGGEPPDAITVVSGNNQRGSPGARLANPFV
ncbi:MAG: Ig-like domain-containing protein, partial [Candidatus Poribacteria bacterium]|nr:Ig-like domain-containing protein [Candidatus Poribacteria bacterium]